MKMIIHLSDLHVGYKHCKEKLSQIIDDIIAEYDASKHVVVVTGDIVDNANIDGLYNDAKDHFRRLRESNFNVLVVPGNHDYGSGAKGKKKYVRLFKKAFFDDTSITYPKVDIEGDIVFIGLDSMAETFDWLDKWGADGELGKRQLKTLTNLLDSADLRDKKKVVYLHHHPFDVRGPLHMLKDHRQLKKIIEGKVDCLLFGHNHDGNQYPGAWSIAQCYDGSSSTGKSQEQGKPATPFRVINLQQ